MVTSTSAGVHATPRRRTSTSHTTLTQAEGEVEYRLNFSDKLLEDTWRVEGTALNIKIGARVLMLLHGLFLFHRLRWRPKRCTHFEHASYPLRQNPFSMESPMALEYIYLSGASLWLMYIYFMPAPRPIFYYPFLIAFLVYILALLEFGEYPCKALSDLCNCNINTLQNPRYKLAVLHRDCSLQGCSSVQIIYFLVLLSPWTVPDRRVMKLYLGVLGTMYFGGILAELQHCKQRFTEIDSCLEFHGFGYLLSVLLLYCALSYFSLVRKYFVEKGQRSKFMSMRRQREASQKIFKLLDCMVPRHVIGQMVRKPGETIAEEVPCASILFVTIEGFDKLARRLSPDFVLEFLNHYFSLFDDICSRHRVTKIETVGEEYVCCVGVVPEEQTQLHSEILGRLIKVAEEILDYSDAAIDLVEGNGKTDFRLQFKMGLHTGPVVAGVLGQKLPRFRLFGDTMNTAARMMQKGEPSQLQFGDATRAKLPAWAAVMPKGEVDMKGKGMMNVYCLHRQRRLDHTQMPRISFVASTLPEEYAHMVPSGPTIRSSGKKGSVVFEVPASFEAPSTQDSDSDDDADEEDSLADSLREDGSKAAGRPKRPACRSRAGMPDSWEGSSGRGRRRGEMEMHAMQHSIQYSTGSTSPTHSPSRRRPLTTGTTSDFESTGRFDLAGEDKKKFDEVLQEVSCFAAGPSCDDSAHQDFNILRRSRKFNAEMEASFLQWFHTGCICKKLDKRLDKQALVLCVITAGEMVWSVARSGALDKQHETYGDLRLPVYVFSRFFAVMIIIGWRSAATRPWLKCSAKEVQRGLAISYAAISLLLFCSYDALVGWEGLDSRYDDVCVRASMAESTSDADIEVEGASGMMDGSIWGLIFVPTFYIVTTQHQLLFVHSFVNFICAWTIVYIHDGIGLNNLYMSMPARMSFIGMALVNLIVAWDMESDARARFRNGHDIGVIHQRIEVILETLLPPMVVPELQGMLMKASVSHRYRDATVVQSDLVGFTRLASTRQPKQVVAFIGELFGLFDDLTDLYEVYKVETVGDAYIACQAGAPLSVRNSPLSVVLFGLDMVRKTREWAKSKGETVSCRVGVHTGECIGGLVGRDLQRYHLFGELMTAVEVLESTAPEGKVQTSKACEQAVLRQLEREGLRPDRITFEQRICPQLVTSKGDVHSYSEVGGPTFVVHSVSRFRGWVGA